MRFGVLGTGMVGRALAVRLEGLGHDVMIGTRDVGDLMARTEPDAMGAEPYAAWAEVHPQVALGTFAEAGSHGDVLVNATNGAGTIAALRAIAGEDLDGKIVIDVSNPIDPSGGMPPSLFVSNTDSLGEQIQRTFPAARVVKTLNTVHASLMVDPTILGGGDHTVFVSGDDADAKATVADLLRAFGWGDILDLGDITTARGVEMYLALWLRLWSATRTAMLNVRVVR